MPRSLRLPLLPLAWMMTLAASGLGCSDDEGGAGGGGGAASSSAGSTVTVGDPVAGPTATGAGGGGGEDATTTGVTGGGGGGGQPGSGGGGAGGSSGQGGAGGAGSGGADDPLWGCLGDVVWDPPEVDPIGVQLVLNDEYGQDVLGGIPVRFCARDDLDCEAPVAEAVSDAFGEVLSAVPSTPGIGFDGYFEVGPGVADNGSQVPLNVVMTVKPWTNDATITEQGIVTAETLGGMLFLAGVEPGEGLGHLAAIAKSCADQPVDGVTVEALSGADAGTVIYFGADGFPDLDADATSTEGFAGGVVAIANLAPGRLDVRSERAATGETITLIDVIVRPGAVTTVGLDPTP